MNRQQAFDEYLAAHADWQLARDERNLAVERLRKWEAAAAEHERLYGYYLMGMQSYQAAINAWHEARAAFDRSADEWDAYWTARDQVQAERERIGAQYNIERAKIAQRWGWSGKVPVASCINAQDRSHAQAMCRQTTRMTYVSGLGGEVQHEGTYYGTNAEGVLWCAIAELPICVAMPPYPVEPAPQARQPGPMPSKPQPPRGPGPAPVVPELAPEPTPPDAYTGQLPDCAPADVVRRARLVCDGAPSDLCEPYASDPCAAASLPVCGTEAARATHANLVVGGVLLLVVAAGGYVAYRTFQKK